MICRACGFKATHSEQIELHHPKDIDSGPKNDRNPIYYRTTGLKPICANCHSLEHRTGDRLLNMCGQWRKKLPGNQKYKNPDDIFTENCPETYSLQKVYFLKWHLTGPEQYKCEICSASTWTEKNKILSLELHHKDSNQSNSLISNLQLLCPNCHRCHFNSF